jgi:hypothetical protein
VEVVAWNGLSELLHELLRGGYKDTLIDSALEGIANKSTYRSRSSSYNGREVNF